MFRKMVFVFIGAFTVASLATGFARAAECTSTLRDEWSSAFGEMIEFNRLVTKARNMGEAYDIKFLCSSSKKVPDFLKIAKEYYPACDPISATRDIAQLEQLNDLAIRLDKLRCSKLKPATTGKKK
jgi:hypothetical protein